MDVLLCDQLLCCNLKWSFYVRTLFWLWLPMNPLFDRKQGWVGTLHHWTLDTLSVLLTIT